MSWDWQLESADGSVISAPNGVNVTALPTQSDAETLLGEIWQSLAEVGVTQVTLFEDGAKVYGPMPLSV
jgi:hypothetical protein